MRLGFVEDDGLVYTGSQLIITARLLESGASLHSRASLEKLPADYSLVHQTFTSVPQGVCCLATSPQSPLLKWRLFSPLLSGFSVRGLPVEAVRWFSWWRYPRFPTLLFTAATLEVLEPRKGVI